jgi:Ca2+-binding RTX toxin-like protein
MGISMSVYTAIGNNGSALTPEDLLSWTGASLASATVTQLTLRIRDGGATAFPGDYDLVLTGTFSVVAGRVISGTVTNIEALLPATATVVSSLTGLSISLTGLISGGGTAVNTPDIPTVFAGVDNMNGGTGNDVLRGYGGGDNLQGGDGDDVFLYQTGDSAIGDLVGGGAGTDTIRLLASTDFTAVNFIQNVEKFDFAQSAGTVTGTVSLSQIANGTSNAFSMVDGSAGTDLLVINNPLGTAFFDLSAVAFTTWTNNVDLVTVNGAATAETITGTSVRDAINGGAGADTIRGGGDADILNGDAGNDAFTYFTGDVIGAETINGGADADEIRIQDAASYDFTAASISNIEKLDFRQITGAATVTLTAAQLLSIGNVDQSVNADALVVNGSAIDLSALTFTSWGNGGDTITLNGTGAADTLTGTVQADIINGGIGADTIRGGLGGDELNGSAGNDVFVVVATNDVANGEVFNGGSDIDTVRIDGTGTYNFNNATFSNTEILDFNRSSGIATVQISGSRIATFTTVDGSAGTDILTVTDPTSTSTSADLSGITFTNWIDGTDLINIVGTIGNDTLIGSSRNDSITGNTGFNTFRGGLGADTLAGSSGDDTFEYLAGSEIISGETLLGFSGLNTVKLLGSGIFDFSDAVLDGFFGGRLDFSQSTGATTAHFSRNVLGSIDTVNILGSAGADALIVDSDGGSASVATVSFTNWTAGVDTITLNGQADIQNSLRGSSEADLLLGANLNDDLRSGSGNDTLSGGAGADQLFGDGGDDLFLFATGDGVAGEVIDGGDGTDTLRINAGASVDFSSVNINNVETLDFTNGSAITLNGNQLRAGGAFTSITGNIGLAQNLTVAIGSGNASIDLSGVTFTDWTSGTDTITLRVDGTSNNGGVIGSSQADVIIGSAFGDALSGGAGSDTIIGGGGADGMDGGAGDDIFFVDNIGDTASENSANGFDIVVSDVNFTLSANVEQLVLRGGATIGIGNDGANFLYGGDSGLSLNLDGRGGDDIFFSSLAGHNTLTGGAGIDTLQLFGGNNFANGGTGSDIYFTFTDTDTISEAGGDGSDTVFANWNFTMGAGIEQLLLFGNANTAVGSADDNVMFGNSTSGAVNLLGLAGSDVLFGGSFNDTLVGGAGNDQLFGLDGNNQLLGGVDNDIYYLASVNNTLTELQDEGFDTIISDLAFTMASNTEQAIIFGSANGIIGNDGDNFIFNVGTAASTLAGGLGNDYLRGSDQSDAHDGGFGDDQLDLRGGGDDRLVYGAGNMGNDIAFGFDADAAGGQDLIDLTGRGYSAASIGAAITIGTVAGDALITFTSGSLAGTSLRLFGVSSGVVEATDFLFT